MGKLTSVEWEQILLHRAYGISNIEISKKMNISKSVISAVLKAFDAVKGCDWEACVDLVTNWRINIALFEWAAEKTGVELPETVRTAYTDRLASDKVAYAAAKSKPTKPDAYAITSENERVFTLKMLEHMAKTNELLEQLMDVVMPKYCADLKDNINANSDIICERLKSCDDKLEGIKANTRKRGV